MVLELEGTVENVVFRSADDAFVVFRLQPLNKRGLVTVAGRVPVPFLGEQISLTGEWVEHPTFGRQVRVQSYRSVAPQTVQGIARYLGSGAFPGVGPALAQRIVARFGRDALDVIARTPEKLAEVDGIGEKKARRIAAAYAGQEHMREVMVFLQTYGVTPAYAARIYRQYGQGAIELVRENPYRLAQDVPGVGFKIADHIAGQLGLARDNPARIAAAVEYVLLTVGQAGHCCVPDDVLRRETAKLLDIDPVAVEQVMAGLIRDASLCTEDLHGLTLVYPRYLYYAERETAERLMALRDQARPLAGPDPAAAVDAWQSETGFALAPAQRDAVVAALCHGVVVVTGGPGTGKTTTIKGILDILARRVQKVVLGAPTGRAAKRLSEATGREASTVHRLLEASGGEDKPFFQRDEDHPLDADVVIIDEVSMMDICLMRALLAAVPPGCRLVLVGDVDQLPAVGPGNVLADIIRADVIPVVRLRDVFRQAAESPIVANAHRINRGQPPECTDSGDFQLIATDDPQQAAEAVVRLCRDVLPAAGYDARTQVQVLSPMHRLACGVENLNRLLQAALNPPGPDKPELTLANITYRLGDKVMQRRNDYAKGVFNGDIGLIARLDEESVTVAYPDGDVDYERAELDELQPAYAMSVHKSQGSEYPVVILLLLPQHHIMLQRNLLYTAVTRAREKVIIVGSPRAIRTAVANDRPRKRYSLLAERLRGLAQ